MRLKDIFEAPPERGPRTNTRPTRPGQEVSGPITRGLPTRPGQDTSGPTPTLPTRPDQSTSGAPTGIRAPGTTTSNLRRGSTGSDVSGLQQMLIDKGYDLGDTGADGKFGPRTAAAVKQFQTDFGLQVDGIAGDQTMSALNRAQGGARPTVGEPGSMPRTTPSSTATTGGRGDGNAELQRRRGYQDGLAAARPPAAPAPGRVDRDQQGSITRPTAPTALPTRPGQDRSGPITRGLPTRPGQDRSGPPAALPTRPGQDRSGPPAALPTRPGQEVSGPITRGLPTRPGQEVSGPRNRRRF
jgi:peptidoglycan hydrolase-like protein with peptidoglycan-binding domain